MKLPQVPKYFSRQAQVAMLGYVVLAVAILLPVNSQEEEYNLTERVVSLLMMILPMLVSVYTINCLVRGSSKGGLPCDVLAWLNSGSILLWAVLVLILTLLMYANGSNGSANGNVNGTVVVIEGFQDTLWYNPFTWFKKKAEAKEPEKVKVEEKKPEKVKVEEKKPEKVKVAEPVKVKKTKKVEVDGNNGDTLFAKF